MTDRAELDALIERLRNRPIGPLPEDDLARVSGIVASWRNDAAPRCSRCGVMPDYCSCDDQYLLGCLPALLVRLDAAERERDRYREALIRVGMARRRDQQRIKRQKQALASIERVNSKRNRALEAARNAAVAEAKRLRAVAAAAVRHWEGYPEAAVALLAAIEQLPDDVRAALAPQEADHA